MVFANNDTVIYQLRWPHGAKPYPLPPNGSGHASYPALLGAAELLIVLATILVLAAREFARIGGPAARQLVRPLTLASYPLLFLTLSVVVVRFALLPSIHGGLL